MKWAQVEDAEQLVALKKMMKAKHVANSNYFYRFLLRLKKVGRRRRFSLVRSLGVGISRCSAIVTCIIPCTLNPILPSIRRHHDTTLVLGSHCRSLISSCPPPHHFLRPSKRSYMILFLLFSQLAWWKNLNVTETKLRQNDGLRSHCGASD